MVKKLKKYGKIKCLLLHIPNPNQSFPEDIQYIPNGLFSLANELSKNGIFVEILHLGIEKKLDKHFSITRYIKQNNINVVGLTLHWFYQTYSTIKIAQLIKKRIKKIDIILGGLTASYFSDKIIKDLRFIDYIIIGSAEKPFVELLHSIQKNLNIENIPNLIYVKNGNIIKNKVSFFLNKKNIIQTIHTDLKFLKNWRHYIKETEPYYYYYHNFKIKEFYFPYFTFYGKCKKNCSFCGGSFYAKRWFSNYFKLPIEKIIADLNRLYNLYNVKHISLCCMDYDQLISILRELNSKKLYFNHFIELCGGSFLSEKKILNLISLFKRKYLISLYLPLNFINRKSLNQLGELVRHTIKHNLNIGITFAVSFNNIPSRSNIGKIVSLIKNNPSFNFNSCRVVPDPGSYDYEKNNRNLGYDAIEKIFNETKIHSNLFRKFANKKALDLSNLLLDLSRGKNEKF